MAKRLIEDDELVTYAHYGHHMLHRWPTVNELRDALSKTRSHPGRRLGADRGRIAQALKTAKTQIPEPSTETYFEALAIYAGFPDANAARTHLDNLVKNGVKKDTPRYKAKFWAVVALYGPHDPHKEPLSRINAILRAPNPGIWTRVPETINELAKENPAILTMFNTPETPNTTR